MRQPRRDDLWDRTPGGVIVPRLPTLPTRRFIQKMGTVQDCCGGIVPDDLCPVCAEGTLPNVYLYNASTICGFWGSATRFITIDNYYNPGGSVVPSCYYSSSGTAPNFTFAIYANGKIVASYSTVLGGEIYYAADYFTGDPPFDCNGIEDLELPFWYKIGTCTGPDSVFVTLS